MKVTKMQEVMEALDTHYPIFFLLCFFSVHIFSGGLWTHGGKDVLGVLIVV